MISRIMFGLLVVALVGALGTTGCRKKGPKAGVDDNIGGDAGGKQSLYDRPTEGSMNILAVKFANVLFDYDSAQIKEGERAKIEAVADFLKKNSGTSLLMEGNCDERGSAEYNMALGERRALAVRAYLIGLGIDGAAIQTKSKGEENPVAVGHDESAWRLNRRAEFVLYTQ
ncbi:MAG: OmpA family protein [Lentisphaerae bacterium]|nr:OmpA family protein [Lentisphaerota bacterium]